MNSKYDAVMKIRLGVIMDPIGSINIKKDSTFAMLLAAQSRGWELHYMEQRDIRFAGGRTTARTRVLRVADNPERWHDFISEQKISLGELDVILMRKDPPFDMEYLFTTYLLETAEQKGALVVNRPRSLRDANEKFYATAFPECCPPTLVTRLAEDIREFIRQEGETILKPLDNMGGTSIFKVHEGDPNLSVIIETLTEFESRYVMAQRFIPEIAQGDKRILLIDGVPVPYALARIPAPGETRGNLAAGGRGVGVPLSEHDRWIADRVGPKLREAGILFAGLDVIGDFLTEINVTSPTCIRELDAQFGLNLGSEVMDCIESKLHA